MNKQLIIGGAVALVVIGGGAAYFVAKDKGTSSSTQSQQSNNDSTQNNVFDAAPMTNNSFSAIITTTSGDKTVTGVMKHDKDTGNTSYSANYDGQESLTVYTADAYYFCQSADKCIKYPLNQIGDNSFDPASYEYTDEEITGFRNSSSYQGKKDCPAGTCDVWKVTQNGYDSLIYIDTNTKRISQVETTTESSSTKIVYDYSDVTVDVPANAQEIPNFQ